MRCNVRIGISKVDVVDFRSLTGAMRGSKNNGNWSSRVSNRSLHGNIALVSVGATLISDVISRVVDASLYGYGKSFMITIFKSVPLLLLAWSLPVAAGAIDELGRCRLISDDVARLACFDRLSGKLVPSAVSPVDDHVLSTEVSEASAPADLLDDDVPEQSGWSSADASSERVGWLGIRPYRRNYILPVTYNSRLNDDQRLAGSGGFEPDNLEIKFQLSFELPIWQDALVDDLDLYFAYTQLSFFQAYNTEYSSPFRDTAYEPEIGFNWHPDLTWSGWQTESLRLALNHQSNGRTEPLSRSWNRLIGQFQVRRDNIGLGLRVWKRFEEPFDEDDNPDIVDYLGHGEVFAGYDSGPYYRYGFMLRNPFDYPTVQLDWSFLLTDNVRLYVQYFNGYGESLIDYNRKVSRIGVGFLLNEWP